MTLNEIVVMAAAGPLAKDEVLDFCSGASMTVTAFCDEFSRVIAAEYIAGRWSFSSCDGAMNHLFAFMASDTMGNGFPDYAFSVYTAFDKGEWHHPKDPAGASPEELYTKPMLAEIIAKATTP